MIFFRLRNNPQIPTKKRVKDTPKILNKLIGIFSLFYASFGDVYPLVCSSNWKASPSGQVATLPNWITS